MLLTSWLKDYDEHTDMSFFLKMLFPFQKDVSRPSLDEKTSISSGIIPLFLWKAVHPSITHFFTSQETERAVRVQKRHHFCRNFWSKIESAKKFSFFDWIHNLTASTNILLDKLIYITANVLSTLSCLFLSSKKRQSKVEFPLEVWFSRPLTSRHCFKNNSANSIVIPS